MDALFNEEFINIINNHKNHNYLSLPYLVTEALMYANIERYFQQVHVRNYIAIDKEWADIFMEKYGREKVCQLFEAHELSIVDLSTLEFTFGKLEGKRLGRSTTPDDVKSSQ